MEERNKINLVFSLVDKTKKPIANTKSSILILQKILKTWNGGAIHDDAVGKHIPAKNYHFLTPLFSEDAPYKTIITNREELLRSVDKTLMMSI
jgi:hypothetical protein